ncbi:MAG: glycosyltransferase, partial [Chloroflexota bacterium]|nr:glycosyltransferase [Chloroflexota bacterium]
RRGPNVIFPGYVFGDGYRELMHNAYAVVLASEVGGTHPVLVEAMAAGNCVVVNDTPANREVVAEAGLIYDGRRGAEALRLVLEAIIADESLAETMREAARERAEAVYSWDAVIERYEQLFVRLMGDVSERRSKFVGKGGSPLGATPTATPLGSLGGTTASTTTAQAEPVTALAASEAAE